MLGNDTSKTPGRSLGSRRLDIFAMLHSETGGWNPQRVS